MKRIFVAVDISEEARREVSSHIETLRQQFPHLRRVGWDKPEKLHLTLKFLGDTDESQLSKLIEIAESAAQKVSNFRLQIANTGVFPNPRNARVLWIDVIDEQGSLSEINRILENKCQKIGFAKEKREYKPHLTIARLREPQKSRQLVEKHLRTKFEPVGFEASEIVIYESKLQPAGSIYSIVSKYKLQGSRQLR